MSRRTTGPYQVHSKSHAKESDSSAALGPLARRERSHLHNWEQRHRTYISTFISMSKLFCSFETLEGNGRNVRSYISKTIDA